MFDKLKKKYKGWSEDKKRFVVGGSVMAGFFLLLGSFLLIPWLFFLFVVLLCLSAFVGLSYMIGDILTTEIKALQ